MRKIFEGSALLAGGAALGFAVALVVHPVAGIVVGLIAGGNGFVGGLRQVYDFRRLRGWAALLLDSTWGLVGTAAGLVVVLLNAAVPALEARYAVPSSRRQNLHVYSGGVRVRPRHPLTFGLVVSNADAGLGVLRDRVLGHEATHVWQGRALGPLYLLLSLLWTLLGTLVAAAIWSFRRDAPLASVVQTVAYYDSPFEYLALRREGRWPPADAYPPATWRRRRERAEGADPAAAAEQPGSGSLDRPTTRDRLDFATYRLGIARTIQGAAQRGELPLTIGIYGPWGSGKTSLMRMVEEELLADGTSGFQVIWFDAWKYASEDELWAALLQRILSSLEVAAHGIDRLGVKWQLWRRRVTWRQAAADVSKRLAGAATFAGVGLAGGAAVSDAVGAGVGAAAGGLGATTVWLRQRMADPQAGVSLDDFRRATSFEQRLGFLTEFSDEFAELTRIARAGTGNPIVLMLDDLDRCLPEQAVAVLEAIKVFVGDDAPVIFVIGADNAYLERAIEVKYEALTAGDGDASQFDALGREYLEKIVQIPFNLPPLRQTALRRFVEQAFAGDDAVAESVTGLSDVFSAGLAANPRQFVRVVGLFRFLMDVAAPDIKLGADPAMLAKLVIIQYRWPGLHAQLVDDPTTLRSLERHYLRQAGDEQATEGADELPEHLVAYADDAFLGRLLTLPDRPRFAGLDADQVRAYLYLTRSASAETGMAADQADMADSGEAGAPTDGDDAPSPGAGDSSRVIARYVRLARQAALQADPVERAEALVTLAEVLAAIGREDQVDQVATNAAEAVDQAGVPALRLRWLAIRAARSWVSDDAGAVAIEAAEDTAAWQAREFAALALLDVLSGETAAGIDALAVTERRARGAEGRHEAGRLWASLAVALERAGAPADRVDGCLSRMKLRLSRLEAWAELAELRRSSLPPDHVAEMESLLGKARAESTRAEDVPAACAAGARAILAAGEEGRAVELLERALTLSTDLDGESRVRALSAAARATARLPPEPRSRVARIVERHTTAIESPDEQQAVIEALTTELAGTGDGDAVVLARSLDPPQQGPVLARVARELAVAGHSTAAHDAAERALLLIDHAPDAATDRMRADVAVAFGASGDNRRRRLALAQISDPAVRAHALIELIELARGDVPAAPPPHRSETPAVQLHWELPDDAEELVRVSAVVSVEAPPMAGRRYAWGLQASFVAGDGTSHTARAALLEWSAGELARTGFRMVGHGGDPSGELVGTWEPGARYLLHISRPIGAAPGRTWAVGVEALDGGISELAHYVTSAEWVADPALWCEFAGDCDDPPTEVRWSELRAERADGSVVEPAKVRVTYQDPAAGGCPNTDVRLDGDQLVMITNAERTTEHGSRLVPEG